MPRYAIVNESRTAILRFVEPAPGEVLLPIEDQVEPPGPGQVQGDRYREIIEQDRVVRLVEARRALSGLVAVLNSDRTVAEYRDLGDELVAAGDHVVSVEKIQPKLEEGKRYGEPTEVVEADKVVLTYPVVDIPPEPVLTATEKLAATGLSVAELRELLASAGGA